MMQLDKLFRVRWLGTFLLILIGLTSFVDIVGAQQQPLNSYVTKTAPPVWATDIDIPPPVETRLDQVKSGVYFLLSSQQKYYRDNYRTLYKRYALKITNREGLEWAANINIGFRPDFDQISIHRLIIHRNGKKIDLLDETQFQIFQRENDLEKGILDGRLTAFVNLPDVRVGDTIEYSYSLSFKSILMSDEFFTNFRTSFGTPVALIESRVIVPEQLDLEFKYSGNESAPVVAKSDGEISYTWLTTDPEPVVEDENEPSWYDARSMIYVSSVKSWADVARNSISHYPPVETLPPEFDAKIKAIGERSSSAMRQIADVLTLVQNEIRYVGIEIGPGAFIPRAPSLVISRGYGDCKDKAYLMVAALHKLGIEAVPALAHLKKGASLQNDLPSPYAFNHVIVRASTNGKTYWLDPTGTQQYSPDPSISQSNYGYVLPISAESSDLEFIKPKEPSLPETRTDETIELNYTDGQPPLTLTVQSIYRGNDADNFRRKLARSGQRKVADQYFDYYKNIYPDIETKNPMEVLDELKSNSIRVSETYQVPAGVDREELFKKIILKGDGVRSVLTSVAKNERTSPIWQNYPAFREHTVKVENIISSVTPLENINISKPYAYFSLKSRTYGKTLEVDWIIKTKRSHILPEETTEYRKMYDQVRDETDWNYDVRESNLAWGPIDMEWMNEIPDWVGGLIVATPIIGFIIFATWLGLKADVEYEASANYFPVSIKKIIIMNIVTSGLYAMFWYWKHWRWIAKHRGKKIYPWVRMLFYPFWAYSAFISANKDEKNLRPLASWFGLIIIIAAVVDIALTIINFKYSEQWSNSWQAMLSNATIIAMLFQVLPAAQDVLRLNQGHGDGQAAIAKNSQFNILNIIAIIFFPFFIWFIYWEN